jgi:hypothetical protein
MTGPQYTSCVQAKDFTPLNEYVVWTLVGFGVVFLVGGIFFPPLLLATAAIIVEDLYYVLDWMLNQKLICLYRLPENCSSICAIGEVGDFEIVGEDKNAVEKVDNDYCINLILAPINLEMHNEFAKNADNYDKNYSIAKASIQGDLITAQPGMPTDDDGNPKYGGYARDFVMLWTSREYENWHDIVGHSGDAEEQNKNWTKFLLENAWLNPRKYMVPVLHCEFEGARIELVLDAIDNFTFGGKWCKKNWFFKLICHIIRCILAPFILPRIANAWANAPGGSQSDALADPASGEVKPKDMVVMRGRWVYDGGHSGYNEMHAVWVLQKIDNLPTVGVDTIKAKLAHDTDPNKNPDLSQNQKNEIAIFEDFRERWCKRLAEVPPKVNPGMPIIEPPQLPLTSEQEMVLASQQRPENQWNFHPALDGCVPEQLSPLLR